VTIAAAAIPRPAARYFARCLTIGQALEHPVITQVFWCGRWRQYPPSPLVSDAELRVLRSRGVTSVQLRAYGHTADFRMTAPLTRRAS
jgi:hypothetical protein